MITVVAHSQAERTENVFFVNFFTLTWQKYLVTVAYDNQFDVTALLENTCSLWT